MDIFVLFNSDKNFDLFKIISSLSKLSENLLFKVLFTNSYAPKNNLSADEFLKIKINWLIKNERLNDLENLLKINTVVGNDSKVVKLLVNEYLAKADIKSACKKTKLLGKDAKNDYLDKFLIYCLINEERKEEAQLVFDLAKESGLKDTFFEDKFNYLLGVSDKTSQKILDNNLLNFFLSHITIDKFEYQPNEKTDKYIWRYLASSNLISTETFEDEEVISTYEKAAAQESFPSEEIFKIYLQIPFNFNQLMNSREIYKNLPTYKARSLIYQKMMLTNDIETKSLNEKYDVKNIVEELLRWDSPLQFFQRWSIEDTEIRGYKIPKNAKVAILLGSANRDDEIFKNAKEINFQRENLNHTSFGGGMHFCLVAHLARLELEASFNNLFEYSWNLESKPERTGAFGIRGFKKVMVSS